MRIAIDFSSIASGGGLTHLRGFLSAAAALDREDEFLLLAPRGIPEEVRVLPPNFAWHVPPYSGLPGPARVVLEQVWIPLWLRRQRADVLFSTADRTSLAAPCPRVVMLQNLNPYEGPPARTPMGRARERLLKRLSAASAAAARRVIFVSQYSSQVIGGQIGIPEGKRAVVYHGVAQKFLESAGPSGPSAQDQGDAPYLLTVSVVRGHKDLPTLIEAFGALVRTSGYADLTLVIAGPVVDAVLYEDLRGQIRRLGLEERVRFPGFVDGDQLLRLYAGARAFAFTSLVETFGLPVLEAMGMGLPTVTAAIPAVQEVAGEHALYYPPGNAPALTAALAGLLGDPERMRSLGESGRARAREFTWERTAAETLAILREASRA